MNKITLQSLRVNVKSLAAETRIIREELNKQYDSEVRASLQQHKAKKVKPESRLAHLSLAFIKGTKYKSAEPNALKLPNVDRLHRKLNRFTFVTKDEVIDWLSE
jgi:chromosomal replication initiation ATPase DnaA